MSISRTFVHEGTNVSRDNLLPTFETMPHFRDDNYLARIEVFFEP